jgi:hypothetical protein
MVLAGMMRRMGFPSLPRDGCPKEGNRFANRDVLRYLVATRERKVTQRKLRGL